MHLIENHFQSAADSMVASQSKLTKDMPGVRSSAGVAPFFGTGKKRALLDGMCGCRLPLTTMSLLSSVGACEEKREPTPKIYIFCYCSWMDLTTRWTTQTAPAV